MLRSIQLAGGIKAVIDPIMAEDRTGADRSFACVGDANRQPVISPLDQIGCRGMCPLVPA